MSRPSSERISSPTCSRHRAAVAVASVGTFADPYIGLFGAPVLGTGLRTLGEVGELGEIVERRQVGQLGRWAGSKAPVASACSTSSSIA